MGLRPVRFVGHHIGPFEHIELNWHEESRQTLIVGENGMGKTTLVAAMASCLSSHLADGAIYAPSYLARFARDERSYAYLELALDGRREATLLLNTNISTSVITFPLRFPMGGDERVRSILNDIGEMPIGEWRTEGQRVMTSGWTYLFADDRASSFVLKNMVAAYGIGRDIESQIQVGEYRELSLAKEALNPFKAIPAGNIFQWIANQFYNNALALRDGQQEDAQAYLHVVKRVEKFFHDGLDYSIAFELRRNPNRLVILQNGQPLEIQQFSDGTRHLLSWVLDYLVTASQLPWVSEIVATEAPGLVLVDEIDAHLHPAWQRRIMSAVSTLLPHTHLIATTHSPFVVASADDTQVFHIYKETETGQLKVKSTYDELYGLPADLVLQESFVDSLYAPEIERELHELSDLADKLALGTITAEEKERHDTLFVKLARVNPWIENLLTLAREK